MAKKALTLILCLIILVIIPVSAAENEYRVFDSAVYQIETEYRIKNIGNKTAEDITLNIVLVNQHLTRASKYSSLLKTSVQPVPNEICIDEKGNQVGNFKIIALEPSGEINIKVINTFKVAKAAVDIDPNNIGEYITVIRAVSPYLMPSPKIESQDPLIISKAKELKDKEKNPYIIARKIFAFIEQHMTYAEKENQPRNLGALSALKTGVGVCEDYADLMVALLRASGIPSRTVSGWMGYVGDNPVQIAKNGETIKPGHIWLEYYVPNYGWIPCDPTYTYVVNNKKTVEYSRLTGIKELRYSEYTELPDSPIMYSFRGGNVDIEFDILATRIANDFSDALDNEPLCLYYEELPLIFDVEPINVNNRILVPLRGVFNVLGARVDYNAFTRQIIIKSPEKEIILSIDDSTSLVNGQKVQMDVSPIIVKDRVLVPIRFVAETMGVKVDWDGQKRSINLDV